MKLTRRDLLRLAQYGAHREVVKIEQQLNELQKTFPDIFVSNERIVLLKAELRDSTNGHRSPSRTRATKIAAAWTPERRAKQARRMRAQMRKKHGTKKKTSKKTSKKKPEDLWKNRWYARLRAHGPESVGTSAEALGTESANLLTGSQGYLTSGTIKKLGLGKYSAGPPPKAEA